MDVQELDKKWNSLIPEAQGTFKSLRISGDCIPDLYIGIDLNNVRCLILKLPEKHEINFASVVKQNLSIELYRQSNWVILKLSNSQYADLFNDLILSLYTKIKDVRAVKEYMTVLIEGFYRWSDFFEDGGSNLLSEESILGLAGELHYLKWELLNSDPIRVNEILSCWQGPFDKGNDFVFSDRNVEVKTKQTDALDVRISSEFQLQPETGKNLRLVVVNVKRENGGHALSDLVPEIRRLVIESFGDFSIFLRAIHQKGLTVRNMESYDHVRIQFASMVGYDCMRSDFPKINCDNKPHLSHNIKYNIRISELDDFIIEHYQ